MSDDLRARLAAEGLHPTVWSNGPSDRYGEHDHPYDKVLVAERGSIVVHLPASGAAVELRAGDRLDLPAGTPHAADVGPDGVTCLEAHLPPGTLAPAPSHLRGRRVSPGATAADGDRPDRAELAGPEAAAGAR